MISKGNATTLAVKSKSVITFQPFKSSISNKRTARFCKEKENGMVTDDDKMLIRELSLSKRWGVKKLMKDFPHKNWKLSTLSDLLRKIDTESVG